MDDNCPSCRHLRHDCGGHWSRRNMPHARSNGGNKAGRHTLDVYDGTHDHGANAYTDLHEQDSA